VIRLRTDDPDRLKGLPGVSTVEEHAGWAVVRSIDADATVRALAASAITWRDVAVSPPSLDDSFLALTTSPDVTPTAGFGQPSTRTGTEVVR